MIRYGCMASLLVAALLLVPGSASSQTAGARTRLSVSVGVVAYKGPPGQPSVYGVHGGVSLEWQEHPGGLTLQLDARGYSLAYGFVDYSSGAFPGARAAPPQGLVALRGSLQTPAAWCPVRLRLGAGVYATDRPLTNANTPVGLELALRLPLFTADRGAYLEGGYVWLYNGARVGALVPLTVGFTF